MEKTNLLYNILAKPTLYRKLQELIGGKEPRIYKLIRAICEEFARSHGRKPRLLDLGCGEGKLCEFVFNDCIYHGLDYSEKYINYAKQVYNGKGTFINAHVSSGDDAQNIFEGWDVIVALGLFHHIDDQDLLQIKHNVFDFNPDAMILTIDPVLLEKQNKIAKFIISKDRGSFVRTLEHYTKLMHPYNYHLDNFARIPYDHILFYRNISLEQLG